MSGVQGQCADKCQVSNKSWDLIKCRISRRIEQNHVVLQLFRMSHLVTATGI